MSLLIQLAIYAALAAGAALAFHEFEQVHYVKPAMESQRAKDEVAYEAQGEQLTAARKQSTDALADVASCTAASKKQSDLVDLWQLRAKQNFDAAQKARAEGQAAHAVAQTAVQRYQQIAAAPPVKDQTCQQKLDATDKLLRDAARLRAAAKAAK
jgi:flagellar basal body-associated protein FliL